MPRRVFLFAAICVGLAGCGGSTPLLGSGTSAGVSALQTTATDSSTSAAADTSTATAPAAGGGKFHVTPADPNTWPEACQVLTLAMVQAVRPGTYQQEQSHAHILGLGDSPHATECEWKDDAAGAYFTWTLQYVKASAADAHTALAGDVQNDTPASGIGDEAYAEPLGSLDVRQGSIVWIMSVVEQDKDKGKADGLTLSRQVAAEFAG